MHREQGSHRDKHKRPCRWTWEDGDTSSTDCFVTSQTRTTQTFARCETKPENQQRNAIPGAYHAFKYALSTVDAIRTCSCTFSPMQSSGHATGSSSSSPRQPPMLYILMDSTTSPFGRPAWLQRITCRQREELISGHTSAKPDIRYGTVQYSSTSIMYRRPSFQNYHAHRMSNALYRRRRSDVQYYHILSASPDIYIG